MMRKSKPAKARMNAMDPARLRRTPAYPYVEAAHYVGVPVATLRSWCVGQTYFYRGEQRQFEPLIPPDGKSGEGLSFLNLVEAHVLAAIRRVHGVSMHRVRAALAYAVSRMKVKRPLLDVGFETNGLDLFVAELEQVVNVSREGQLEMAELIRASLTRIERDPHGVPIKLYPFTGRQVATDSPAPVEIDPQIAFGRPVLRGRAVPTAVLADRFKAGDSLHELANDYDVSPEAIEEAIRCELDRKAA
jgi:uncharacterized protein (DUF433 family)